MGAGGRRGDKHLENGREGKFVRTELLLLREGRRETRGLEGEVRWGEGARPTACPSPYFSQQTCYIITEILSNVK